MQCLKCGREIAIEQVFCPDCLADMEKYPVKPGTVVHIPKRPAHSLAKKLPVHRHPPIPLEDQVKHLKKRVAALTCALLISLAVVAGLCWFGVKQYLDQGSKLLPGQNYSSAASFEPEDAN